jgi:hypothetical protein
MDWTNRGRRKETDEEVTIPCDWAANSISEVVDYCCQGDMAAKSGSVYTDKYSVWAGYGNCNHPSGSRPTNYGYPGGNVNGLCVQ